MLWLIIPILLIFLLLTFHALATLFVGRAINNEVNIAINKHDDIVIEKNHWLIIKPRNTSVRAGFIFHSGGYVDEAAYIPLLAEIARQNICCIVVSGPGRLGILNRFAADRAISAHPEIKNWFIGGHSLGGAVTNFYIRDRWQRLEKQGKLIKGLVFLGCYFGNRHTLAHLPIPALSVFGSEDGFAERFEPNHHNLPQNKTIKKIEGGNHGQFGSYGLHLHDNPAKISRTEQQRIAQKFLIDFINTMT